MESIEKLREWAKTYLDWPITSKKLGKLIDAIEDEALSQRNLAWNDGLMEGHARGYDEGFASADDWLGQHEEAMAEHGWMKRPIGHDGKPWYVFDELETARGEVKTVAYVCDGGIIDDEGMFYLAQCYDHHHEPTVEDVLREFGKGWHERMVGPETFDIADYVEQYAAKLRLAGDE